MSEHWRQLPTAEFAFPGPLRDKLVAAILSGAKTTTTSLLAQYDDEEPVPQAGQRAVVIDSHEEPVAVIETVEVRVVRLADVDLEHAIAEGEGDTSVAQWRASHEGFWNSPEAVKALGDPDFEVTDDTLVVMERFVRKEIEKLL